MRDQFRSASFLQAKRVPPLEFVRYGPPEFENGLWMCRKNSDCVKQYDKWGDAKEITLTEAPKLIDLYLHRVRLKELLLEYTDSIGENVFESLVKNIKKFGEIKRDNPFSDTIIVDPNMKFVVRKTISSASLGPNTFRISPLDIRVRDHNGMARKFASKEEAENFIIQEGVDVNDPTYDFYQHYMYLDIQPEITVSKVYKNAEKIAFEIYATIKHDVHTPLSYKLTFTPWAVHELYPPKIGDKLVRRMDAGRWLDGHINDAMNFICAHSEYDGYEHEGLWNGKKWLTGEVMVCGKLARNIIKDFYGE